jgi:quinol monooxygenase YgiN
MIHVIASIQLKPGVKDQFLAIFKSNVPAVLAEKGCLAYGPTVDADSGLPPQGGVRPDTVIIVEQWESLDALRAHLATPHMASYREKVKNMTVGMGLQVLQPV